MKRPLTAIGFTMLFTLLVMGSDADGLALVTVSITFLMLFGIALIFRKIRQTSVAPAVFLGVAVACLLLFFSDVGYNRTLEHKGESLTVKGTVAEMPEFNRENGRHYCVINLSEISGENADGRLRMSFSETKDEISHERLKIGDKVEFTGTVYEVGENNESTKRYFRSQGISLGAYSIRNLTVKEPLFRGVYYYASVLREKATDVILRHFNGDTAGLMIAVLTGDKAYLSDEFYDAARYSGVSHLMAVSGLHLSLWVFIVGAVLEIKGRKEKYPYIIMLFAVIFMMNFASLSGSVKRAGLMTILYLIGKILGRNADALNSLGFALTAIILHNPYAIYDVGFMLSLFSTLGILVMAFPLSNRLLRNNNAILEGTFSLKLLTAVTESILVSLSVALFTLPITTYYFGYISSVSVITNLIILPFCMPLVAVSGLFSIFSTLPIISTNLGITGRCLSELIIKTVTFMGTRSYSKIHLDYDFLFPSLILGGVALFSIAMLKSKKAKKLIAVVFSVIFTFSFTSEYNKKLTTHRVLYFSDNCYLVSVKDKGVLIGFTGDYYLYESICDHIERTGVKIEAVLPDDDAEYLNLNYAEYELGARIIEGDCRISLYGIAEVEQKDGNISVTTL